MRERLTFSLWMLLAASPLPHVPPRRLDPVELGTSGSVMFAVTNTTQLKLLLQTAGWKDLVPAALSHIFTQMDYDGNGIIRPEEWAWALFVRRDRSAPAAFPSRHQVDGNFLKCLCQACHVQTLWVSLLCRYSLSCPTDAAAAAAGSTWPGCMCSASGLPDLSDMGAGTSAAVNVLSAAIATVLPGSLFAREAGAADFVNVSSNATSAQEQAALNATALWTNVSCPVGYRCSRWSQQRLIGVTARRGGTKFLLDRLESLLGEGKVLRSFFMIIASVEPVWPALGLHIFACVLFWCLLLLPHTRAAAAQRRASRKACARPASSMSTALRARGSSRWLSWPHVGAGPT
jgi:hypothetical protein